MTLIRWTEPANADFLGVIEWLMPRNPQAEEQVGRAILAAVDQLTTYPLLGKKGCSPDMRELHIGRYPYLIVYEVGLGQPAEVAILRVLHGAMLWPPEPS